MISALEISTCDSDVTFFLILPNAHGSVVSNFFHLVINVGMRLFHRERMSSCYTLLKAPPLDECNSMVLHKNLYVNIVV